MATPSHLQMLSTAEVEAIQSASHYIRATVDVKVPHAGILEQLVDVIVLECRSLEVDVADFRRITAGAHIKLYPCLDDHHASDGYYNAPIEVLRGRFRQLVAAGRRQH